MEFYQITLGVAGTEIRINEVFADRKKGSFCSNRPRIYCETEAQTQTFTSDTLSLWQRHARCNEQIFLVKPFYSSRRRRWPWCQHPPDPRDDRPQRDHRLCHRERRLKDRRNQVDFQTRSLVKAPPYSLPNTSQMIWVTQKTPGKLEPGTICHIVLPATAVNIRMICDTHVQQGGTNIDQ